MFFASQQVSPAQRCRSDICLSIQQKPTPLEMFKFAFYLFLFPIAQLLAVRLYEQQIPGSVGSDWISRFLPRHNGVHRETRRNHTHSYTCVDCAYHNMCPGVFVCVHAGGAKSQAKGPKANKEQEERSSRKLTSHFIPLPSVSRSLSLSSWADAGIKGESCS